MRSIPEQEAWLRSESGWQWTGSRAAMADVGRVPHSEDALSLIRDCVRRRRVLWTYHANMRLTQRSVSRAEVLGSVESCEVMKRIDELLASTTDSAELEIIRYAA